MTTDKEVTPFIFVYGTLREDVGSTIKLGQDMGDRLRKASMLVGSGTVIGTLYDVGMFPALISDGENIIQGELYEVTHPDIFVDLDWFESNGEMYSRKIVDVLVAGERYRAWVYFYLHNVEELKEIECGDYYEYTHQN